MTNEYLTFFVVKQDMFHAFFEKLKKISMNVDFSQSKLSNSQIETSTTNHVIRSQNSELFMITSLLLQTSMMAISQQSSFVVQTKESSIKNIIRSPNLKSQVAILFSLQVNVSMIRQSILSTFRKKESETKIVTRSQNSKLQIIISSSSLIGQASRTNQMLNRIKAIEKHKK